MMALSTKPKTIKTTLVLSAYYVALIFAAAGCSDACRRKLRRPLLKRHQANAPQVRGEVWNRTPHQQNFAVQGGNETGNGYSFERRNLLEDLPEHLFEPDTGALPIEPDRTRLIDVALRILAGKQMAHAFLPLWLVFLCDK